MNIDNIKMLLSRYYDGTSSLADERTLTEYFTSAQEIPSELEADRRMFQAFAEAGTEAPVDDTVPEGLDRRMSDVVDGLERRHSRRMLMRVWGGAAAAVVLICGVVSWNYKTAADTGAVSGLSDEDVCYYTESSLRMLVSTMGRGVSESAEAQKTLLTTTADALEKVEKTL
ncbi:MAG: hypothetical protein K2M98_04755 [Muribaculum sp.]|nr:hypothetical protein [Muribaculum sp.]